jgi:hypothetical protein
VPPPEDESCANHRRNDDDTPRTLSLSSRDLVHLVDHLRGVGQLLDDATPVRLGRRG